MLTDKDILRDEIERVCVIDGLIFTEKDRTITIPGRVKYIFETDGTVKSIIKDGKSFGPDGSRRVQP